MSDDDYGFEYSDDDQEEDDVNIENQYYNAKGDLKDGNPDEALTGFQQVVTMEEDKGEWGFKVRPCRRAASRANASIPTRFAASHAGVQADGEAALQAQEVRRDDGGVQADAHLHQERRHAQLLREGHQQGGAYP